MLPVRMFNYNFIINDSISVKQCNHTISCYANVITDVFDFDEPQLKNLTLHVSL